MRRLWWPGQDTAAAIEVEFQSSMNTGSSAKKTVGETTSTEDYEGRDGQRRNAKPGREEK